MRGSECVVSEEGFLLQLLILLTLSQEVEESVCESLGGIKASRLLGESRFPGRQISKRGCGCCQGSRGDVLSILGIHVSFVIHPSNEVTEHLKSGQLPHGYSSLKNDVPHRLCCSPGIEVPKHNDYDTYNVLSFSLLAILSPGSRTIHPCRNE